MIGISPCSSDVFAPLLNKLVYVLDSLMAGHYKHSIKNTFYDNRNDWEFQIQCDLRPFFYCTHFQDIYNILSQLVAVLQH